MSFKDFISHERNLDKVIRFSAKGRIKDQTVAEHLYHTSLYAMIMADLETQMGNKVDVERVLRSTLIHDLEESLTGDIIFDFKHSDEKVAEDIKNLGRKFFEDMVAHLPGNVSEKYTELWVNAKDENKIEGRIMHAADRFEALAYAMEEKEMGNKNFDIVIEKLVKELKNIKLKSVDLILEGMGV
jgi:5'-deoxynucleotidase YfbR-like HD superfamily hydrolase